jgi:acetyltransferase-like isoleucine patch superfamily enzyme
VNDKLVYSTQHQYPRIIREILKLIYKKSGFPFRGLIYYLVTKFEGGEYWSTTLREIFSEVHEIHVGIGSYGCFRPIEIPKGTIIGNYCSIAENVRFIGSNHPISYASTHPMFYISSLGSVDRERVIRTTTLVGHDVWIGYNSLVLSSCFSIGTGAIIAAGSIVTDDVEPYLVVAGVPAKPIKKRFSSEIMQKLLESQWFLLNPLELSQIANTIDDPEKFVLQVEKLRESTL